MAVYLCVFLVLVLIFGGFRFRKNTEVLRSEVEHLRRLIADGEARQFTHVAQQNAEQQALFNSMVEGVMVLDASGKIRLVNLSLARMFQTRSELIGKSLIEAFGMHQLTEIVDRLRNEKQIVGAELSISEQSLKVLQISASSIIGPSKVPEGAILVFQDVTRLKDLETTRQDFVANVSHELRTPLSLIKGYVEALLDGARNNPEVAEKFLQTIEKHANRLTFLIDDLLTISLLESGQMALNLQTAHLRDVAQRVTDDLQSKALAKRISISNDFPADLAVKADADRIQQVLFNLVDNAIKYSHPGSSVFLEASTKNGEVLVSVRDTGPGIPADGLDRVFERFYRVDKGRSREQGGTGLGLSIVKHIVQSHGGEVGVESELGKGSTFYFSIPARPHPGT